MANIGQVIVQYFRIMLIQIRIAGRAKNFIGATNKEIINNHSDISIGSHNSNDKYIIEPCTVFPDGIFAK